MSESLAGVALGDGATQAVFRAGRTEGEHGPETGQPLVKIAIPNKGLLRRTAPLQVLQDFWESCEV